MRQPLDGVTPHLELLVADDGHFCRTFAARHLLATAVVVVAIEQHVLLIQQTGGNRVVATAEQAVHHARFQFLLLQVVRGVQVAIPVGRSFAPRATGKRQDALELDRFDEDRAAMAALQAIRAGRFGNVNLLLN